MSSHSAMRRGAVVGSVVTGLAGGASLTAAGAFASAPVAAAACLAAGAGVALLFAPQMAFLATVLVIPVERLGRITPDSAMYTLSLMRFMGLIALASFLVHAFLRRRPIFWATPLALYGTFAVVAVLGVFHTSDTLGTVRGSGAILGNLLFFFLVTNSVRDRETAHRAIAVWLASTVLICLYTMYTWHFGGGASELDIGDTANRFSSVLEDTSEWEQLDTVARATGPTSHSAVYGINLLLTIPFFFYFLRRSRSRWWRAALGAGLILVIYNVLLTNTRAAILLAVLLIVLAGLRGLFRVTAGTLAAGTLAVLSLLPLVPSAIYDRVLDPANYSLQRAHTLRIRLEYWQAGLQVAQDNWLAGIGVGNQQVVPRYIKGSAPAETTVHNEYLMTFMETGLPGWILFFGFVGMVTVAAFQAGSRIRQAEGPSDAYWFMVACQLSMVAVLLFGTQVDVFHFPLKGWWLVAGVSWMMWRLSRSQQAASPTKGAPRVIA
jgi:hypothetical protein